MHHARIAATLSVLIVLAACGNSGPSGGGSGGGSAGSGGGSAGGSGGGSAGGAGGGSAGGAGGGSAGGAGGGSAGGAGGGSGTQPTISFVDPQSGLPGTNISLGGTNLPASASQISVALCGTPATGVALASGGITFNVPNLNAGPCALVLTTPGGSVTWSSQFAVLQQRVPFGIAVDATFVYWADHVAGHVSPGSIKRVALDGGAVTTLATGNEPYGVALDGTNLYWTDNGSGAAADGAIFSLAKAGGTPMQLVNNGAEPWAITVDPNAIYWSDIGNGKVWAMGKDGSNPHLIAGPGTVQAEAIAAGGGAVYWTDHNLKALIQYTPSTQTTVALTGTIDIGRGSALALGGQHAFLGGNTLYQVALDGGGATPLTVAASGTTAMAVDATMLYWGDSAGIHAAPLDGGAALQLVADQAGITSLAIDSDSIYWAETTPGAIKRVAKDGGTASTLANVSNVE